MRKLLLPALMAGFFGLQLSAQCASSFALSGSWSQKAEYDQPSDLYYATTKTKSSLKASLPMAVNGVDESSELVILFQPSEFSDPLGIVPDLQEIRFGPLSDDPAWRPGKTSATLVYREEFESGTGPKTTVKLSWTSTNLSIDITSDYCLGGVSDFYLYDGEAGISKFAESYNMGVEFGMGGAYSHVVELGGANSRVLTSQDLALNTGNFKITGDFTPPQLTITAPKNGYKTNAGPVLLSGKAKSRNGISDVVFSRDGYEWMSTGSEDLTNWTFLIEEPDPGINNVWIKVLDMKGNTAIATSQFILTVTNELVLDVLSINSDRVLGQVIGLSSGQNIIAGQIYTATAVPKKGAIFVGWFDEYGNVFQSSAKLKWLAPGQPNGQPVTIRALFAEDPYPSLKGTYTGLFYRFFRKDGVWS